MLKAVRNKFKRSFLIGIIGIAFLLGLGIVLLNWMLYGGYIRDTLPVEYVPTAEYLVQNPQTMPAVIRTIAPRHGSSLKQLNEICIIFNSQIATANSLAVPLTRIFLNNQPVSMAESDDLEITTSHDPSARYEMYDLMYCLSVDLKRGYHLVKVQFANSLFDVFFSKSTESYEWAYRVD